MRGEMHASKSDLQEDADPCMAQGSCIPASLADIPVLAGRFSTNMYQQLRQMGHIFLYYLLYPAFILIQPIPLFPIYPASSRHVTFIIDTNMYHTSGHRLREFQ
jgi:hypothetical protein